ncbi:TPA: LysR family transcriptional regulator [Vibrio vulnificus]|nr:LysR family transcriptional regulator [Vibrio vulnificus]HDY7690522.1 LysR family transcriptional regulator [Vibrio vulnificus]
MNKIITLKHLKTFNKVVELKSFTAAAESLFMTQPAVSQHIKKLKIALVLIYLVKIKGLN